jgi:hypothetical protein
MTRGKNDLLLEAYRIEQQFRRKTLLILGAIAVVFAGAIVGWWIQ